MGKIMDQKEVGIHAVFNRPDTRAFLRQKPTCEENQCTDTGMSTSFHTGCTHDWTRAHGEVDA